MASSLEFCVKASRGGGLAIAVGPATGSKKSAIAERFAMCRATRPDIETHTIPACGHWAMYEAHETVNALLLDFHGHG